MFYSIPVHLIRQYCFCERIPYYQELLKLNPARPYWVKQGEKLHKNQKRLFKGRTLKRFGLEEAAQEFEVKVSDEILQLHGLVDSVLTTKEEIYPIEFKLSGSKPVKGQILQLTAYGMLLEKQFNVDCKKGFILFEQKGKTITINFTEKHKQNVLKIRNEILQSLSGSLMPHSSASSAQCTQCEYLNYCNDRG